MGIALGIDYGTKRTGIAITDPMRIIASGLTTVSTNSLEDFIDDIVIKKDVNCFVVGKSINLDGGYNQVSDHVHGFVKRLRKKYPEIEIHEIDERFTSKIAKRSILKSGVNKKKRRNRALVDQVSATILLQDYLDYL